MDGGDYSAISRSWNVGEKHWYHHLSTLTASSIHRLSTIICFFRPKRSSYAPLPCSLAPPSRPS